MDGEAEIVPTICLLGGTGTGKSSTGNSLFSSHVFDTSEDTASMTSRPMIKELPWRGTGERIRCVDLPGLADTQGKDSEHIAQMAEILKTKVRYVHAFLVIINSQVPRFDWQLQDMLLKFKNVFGEEFLRNVMLGFTRWEFKRSARRKRERDGQTEADKARKFNADMRGLLGHGFDWPCFFVNNSLTAMTEEDLEDEYGDEVPVIRAAFDVELHKVYSFVRSREPFLCRNIEAVLAEREDRKRWVNTMLRRAASLDLDERLGRQLISADNDFVRGWLRLRRPPGPPRSVWAVVRRQQLQLFSDDSEAELVGPQEIELLNCICGKAGWHLLSGRCFLIYKPVQDSSSLQVAEKYEFGVDAERDRRRWMFLVQEATRISESWSRILWFYESLHSAHSLAEYIQAIKRIANETMVIPMEWVRMIRRRREGAAAEAAQPERQRELDLRQAQRDLERDCFTLDGRTLTRPSVDDLATDVVLRLLKWASGKDDKDEAADEKALLLARDVVVNCSRTTTNGDIFDAVIELFGQEDLVHTPVDQSATEPVCVRILRPDGTERVLQQDFLRSLDASTGLPQFQSDASAAALDIEQVRSMSVEDEQRLQVTHAHQDSWVPDWELLQCMKCGVQFGTWVRRHHCRHCGALICSSCSQHSVELVGPGADTSRPQIGRVCFTCYQKAVVSDLNARRAGFAGSDSMTSNATSEAGMEAAEAEPEAPSESLDTECEPRAGADSSEAGAGSFCSSLPEEGEDWPIISIEMTAAYRVCDREPEPQDLFLLHCRHVRQVRWSGVSDAGRVVISIEEKRPG